MKRIGISTDGAYFTVSGTCQSSTGSVGRLSTIRSQESSNQNSCHQASGYKTERIHKPHFLIEIEFRGRDADSLNPSLPGSMLFAGIPMDGRVLKLPGNGRIAPLVDTELHSTCQTEID